MLENVRCTITRSTVNTKIAKRFVRLRVPRNHIYSHLYFFMYIYIYILCIYIYLYTVGRSKVTVPARREHRPRGGRIKITREYLCGNNIYFSNSFFVNKQDARREKLLNILSKKFILFLQFFLTILCANIDIPKLFILIFESRNE